MSLAPAPIDTADPTSPQLSVGMPPIKRPRRWAPEAWAPLIGGLLWLRFAGELGVIGFLLSVIPGCLLLSCGVALLFYPGDLRIPQFAAAGGVVGFLLAWPMLIFAGLLQGVLLLLTSVASFFAAGWYSVRQDVDYDDVPAPQLSLGLAAQVAIDETILATLAVRSPLVDDPERILVEVHRARELFEERGWLAYPESYHREPPPLDEAKLEPMKVSRYQPEHLSFVSGYEPHPDEPGRDRWLGYENNRVAHAWVFRHRQESAGERSERRPWLICIHGYEMGVPRLDMAAFRVMQLHHQLGFNLVLPVLPLHGLRRIARRSGEGFLAGDFLDTVHAEAQAMWDMRRMLAWIRAQGAGKIGVFGLSLGGYNAALLSSLDDDLACALLGIPAVDFVRLTWRHGPTTQIRYAERNGLVHDEVSEVLQVISPLAMTPKVPHDRRFLFAGVADRLVPADQPRDLWEHWERPRIEWYQGGHVTFRAHDNVDKLRLEALQTLTR